MWYPLVFEPIFMERVWGGRNLEQLYQKALPPQVPIGESWEISDRPEANSPIANGSFKGKTLRWLMENHRNELLGNAPDSNGRFPLLIKILDATEKLSLQVHPPAHKCQQLKGESKTEMWYFTHCTPQAGIYVGLKPGVTRQDFESRIHDGSVAECFHRHSTQPGACMFLPSGRVHALDQGNVIFEVQENSDTTYRVFDWNRKGLDGKPRDLHIPESLESIDFNDFAPPLVHAPWESTLNGKIRSLTRNPLFSVDEYDTSEWFEESLSLDNRPAILAIVDGELQIEPGTPNEITLRPGRFCLLPAALETAQLSAKLDTRFLWIQPGPQSTPSTPIT